MRRIHEELQAGRLRNAKQLGRILEVSEKTILRDVRFMRDELGLPIEYDDQLYSFRYTYPVKSFPLSLISEGELLAMLVAEKALKEYEGTPYHKLLETAFRKLTDSLHGKVSFAPGLLDRISVHHAGIGRAQLEVFEKLILALRDSREVELAYHKPGAAAAEQRRVRPYHLANRENSWYLVAYDIRKGALRHFAVARMLDLKVTAIRFEIPADFDPEEHFARCFGAFVGKGDYTVVVRFSPKVADRVKERLWHQSQTEVDRAEGGVDITVRVDNLEDVAQWVLGWGPDARVISPPELVERVRVAIDGMRRVYDA